MKIYCKKGENIGFEFKWDEIVAAYVALYGLRQSGLFSEQNLLVVDAQLAKIKFLMDEKYNQEQKLLEDKRFKSHMCNACFRMFKEGEEYAQGSEEGYVIYWHLECPPSKDQIQ